MTSWAFCRILTASLIHRVVWSDSRLIIVASSQSVMWWGRLPALPCLRRPSTLCCYNYVISIRTAKLDLVNAKDLFWINLAGVYETRLCFHNYQLTKKAKTPCFSSTGIYRLRKGVGVWGIMWMVGIKWKWGILWEIREDYGRISGGYLEDWDSKHVQ